MPDIGTPCKHNGESVMTDAPSRQQTVGENLDQRIAACRQRLEELCIIKAKAETCGLLDYPHNFLENVVYP